MPVLVTSNYNDDLIKNEQGTCRMETPFSNYKSMGNVLDAQGQLQCNSLVSSPIWKKFKLVRDFLLWTPEF